MSTRLLVISNRAPYTVRRRGRKTELTRTVGGLASTLDDTLRRRGGVWLAWSGTVARGTGPKKPPVRSRKLRAPGSDYELRLLTLTEQQVAEYYHGFSNRSLWPLCHYFIARMVYDPDYWKTYESVNRLFARTASTILPPSRFAWVHDFQLALVPAMLRSLRPDARIATFWHIPFPPPAVFRVNPHAREIVAGMLGADLIGFHTEEYARHFLECARDLCGAKLGADGRAARHHGHTAMAAAFPLGIEARTFSRYGSDRRVLAAAQALRQRIGTEKMILAVDRLDYTKGILERLQAYEQLLAAHPELHRKVTFVQIQVPSRVIVPEYRSLRDQIDRKIGGICGRFSSAGWVPVVYLCRGFSRQELAAYYRAADVMLVTPLRDGMNLVAQEFVATRADEDGVLVFSAFAGAAERLREALIVNPYDVASIADTTLRALRMRPVDRQTAMRAMRQRVLAEDVEWWLHEYLEAAHTSPAATRPAAR